MDERRRFPRLNKPLDGTWRGHSGASACRIVDIGWGGCFIGTLAEPAAGEWTAVIVPIRNTKIEITGHVGYVVKTFGFSVIFDKLNPAQIDALTDLLGEPPPELLA